MTRMRENRTRTLLPLIGAISTVFLLFYPGGSSAQTFEILHTFQSGATPPMSPLILADDGNYYGTTSSNSSYYSGNPPGTVYRVAPSGETTTIYTFSGYDGGSPNALTKGADGYLYGTTKFGGSSGNGTVFRISTSGQLATLYSFSGWDGANPSAGLVQGPDGLFYGTTSSGGLSPYYPSGTVFRIDSSGLLEILHFFSGIDGSSPGTALIEASDGYLYGTTNSGGTSGYGTVFRISTSGLFTSLYSAGGNSFYSTTFSSLCEGADGAFYGTISSGGTGGGGAIFRITPAGAFSVLYSFYGAGPSSPMAGLLLGTDGNFYATTSAGGAYGFGTVFSVTPAGDLTLLHSFSGFDGAYPRAELIQIPGGDLLGTAAGASTNYSAPNHDGTVFRISTSGQFSVLHTFPIEWEGVPNTLIEGLDGNLYGTTTSGGPYGYGSFFRLNPSGAFETLYSFTGGDGRAPSRNLTLGSDGSFFGTTNQGGLAGSGTIFKASSAGALTTLHSFSPPDGSSPAAAPAEYGGVLIGTAQSGSSTGSGTIYRYEPPGIFTTLHSFQGSEGSSPGSTLARGADGAWYGTTTSTIFRVTDAGAFTVIYAGMGMVPYFSDLYAGSDGNLYGVTAYGGDFNYGTFFQITPAGQMTVLHSFSSADGGYPSTFTHGTDGLFYGTTNGDYNSGIWTIFSVTESGVFTILYSLKNMVGFYATGIAQASDHRLYGSASGGQTQNLIFRLDPDGPKTPQAVVSGGGSICQGGSITVQAELTGTPPWTLTWSDGIVQTGINMSPVTRVVSPASSEIYFVTALSDANVTGFSYGSANVSVTPPLASVYISQSGSSTICSTSGSTISSSSFGGGYLYYQWGYRTVPGGLVTSFPNNYQYTSSYYQPSSSDFPAPGTYYVVVAVTPQCGQPMVSNEVAVTVGAVPATPVITAPAFVGAGSPRTASVPLHAGSTYSWSGSYAAILSGQGTNQITFAGSLSGVQAYLQVTETNSYGCTSSSGSASVSVLPRGSALQFYTVTPCRVVDTRAASEFPYGYGPPSMAGNGAQRTFVLAGQCGIPADAIAVSANATVWAPVTRGDFRIFPAGAATPTASVLNWEANILALANSAFVPLGPGGAIVVQVDGSGTVDVFIDVNGYFQ